jgi:quercetin 2,3-dioxygenase
VPSIYKMNDPIYGTEPPQNIPQEVIGTNAKARLLAGPMGSRVGAFKTKANVQIVDFDLEPGAEMTHTIPQGMSTVMLYIYEGTLLINHDQIVGPQAIAMLDGSNDSIRTFDLSVDLSSDSKSASAILFVGEPLKEPIAWRGPIVMNTKAELQQTFNELRSGSFPPVRVPWDYHCINQKPV